MAKQPRKATKREEEIVHRALREFAELQGERNVFAGQWEESAQILVPTARNTFFFGSYNWQGQKKTDRQVDMSGGLALHRFCAIADSLVTPRNLYWHALEADGPRAEYVMKDKATRQWFEDLTKILFRYRYSQVGNFPGQNYNIWQSLGAFGNATMFVDRFDDRLFAQTRGLRYRAVPLGETFYGENHQGVVDRVHRWFRLTAYQAVQKFGEEWLPPNLQYALEADSQYRWDFLHVVRPRDGGDYDPKRLDERGKPFESYYICISGRCMMAPESGYRKFPYAVSRYDQTPGEVYGRGPAQIVLPSLKTLNAQKSTYLKTAHRSADPILLTSDDGLVDFDMRPGALNKGGLTPEGKKLVDTLPVGQMQVAVEMMDLERALIEDTFLVSLFKVLTEHPNMTATQVIELVNEKGMLVAPTLGRQHSEYIPAMVEREIDLLSEQGLIPPMPPRLREARGEYRIVDASPLALAARAGQAAGFLRSVESTGQLVNITQDPSLLDNYNFDEALPEVARIQNVAERWLSSPRQVAAKRQQRAQAVARKQEIDALPAKAAIMKAQAVQAKAGMGQQGAPVQPQPLPAPAQ